MPEPLGAPDEYGDVDGGLEVADLTEVRWAADRPGRTLDLLARVANLTDPSRLGVLVLADLDDATPAAGTAIGHGTSLTTDRFDRAVLLTADGAAGTDLATGAPLDLRPRRGGRVGRRLGQRAWRQPCPPRHWSATTGRSTSASWRGASRTTGRSRR